MKRLKRLGIILMCTVALNVCTVFAAATQTVLNREEAVRLATENSTELKKLALEVSSNREQTEKISDAYFNNPTAAAYVDYETNKMQNNLSKALTEQNIAKQKDMIEFLVSQYFISIIQEEIAYKQFEQSLVLEEQEFKITELKRNLGMISEADYASKKAAYEKNIASKIAYEESIENAYRTLNRLIGSELDTRYRLAYNVSYEELGEFDLAAHIKKAKQNDRTLQTLETNIEKTHYSLNHYNLTNHNPLTGELTEGRISRESLNRDLETYRLEQSERNKTIEDTFQSKYDAILVQERQYKEKLTELENLKKQLEIKEVQLTLGKITPLEVENHKFSILKLENEIQRLVYNHQMNILEFSNINLM